MPNWFIALVVPGAFVENLPTPPTGFRRFHREDTHLTLAFLGPSGEPAATRAWAALLNLQLAPSDLKVGLDRVVPMGNPKHYSALSALLSTGREEIEQMIARTRDILCDAAGAPRDKRAPKAHITIARPQRSATQTQRRAGLQWSQSIDLRPSI